MIRSCMSLICDFMAYRWLHVMETQGLSLHVVDSYIPSCECLEIIYLIVEN